MAEAGRRPPDLPRQDYGYDATSTMQAAACPTTSLRRCWSEAPEEGAARALYDVGIGEKDAVLTTMA
jgi:hypothetical protein